MNAKPKRPLRFLSVCSGIEAASQALHRHGFECAAVSEIEPHPCAVLAHRFGASRPWNMPDPDALGISAKDRTARKNAIKAIAKIPSGNQIPNFGDMSRFQEWPDAEYDALFGGTPCQSFSIAGLRAGLDDPRGNLMLTYGAIAARYRPRWICWENVTGVLSSDGGRDFASLLGLLTGREVIPPPEGWQNSGIVPGIADAYGIAWRVLDAQYSRTLRFRRAVPQRRRRVFLVGYLGDWRRAAAVLFDRESLRRDPPPRREAGQSAPASTGESAGGCRKSSPAGNARPGRHGDQSHRADAESYVVEVVSNAGDAAFCLTSNSQVSNDAEMETLVSVQAVAHTLRGEGHDATDDGSGKGIPIIPVQPFTLAVRGREDARDIEFRQDGTANALQAGGGGRDGMGVGAIVAPVAYPADVAGTMSSQSGQGGKHGFGMGQQDWESGYAVPVAFNSREDTEVTGDRAGPLGASLPQAQAIAFDPTQITSPTNASNPQPGDPCHTLAAIATPWAVRRLTPVECERLMGMEDNLTNIPWRGRPSSPDANRYKELGNSWALNSIDWIGERMVIVDSWDD